MRNAMHPLIMILGGSLPGLISGETIIALVMNIPTVGPMYFNAQLNQDLYLAITFLMFLAILGCDRQPAGGYRPGLGRSAHPLRVTGEVYNDRSSPIHIPQPAPERQTFVDEPVSDVGDLSQTQLMRIRFSKNKLAMLGLLGHDRHVYHRFPGRFHRPQLVSVPGYGIYLRPAQPDHL